MAERELKRSEQSAIRKLVTELCANYDSQEMCIRDRAQSLFKGARIGQLVITPTVIADFVTDLGTERGTGSFGSTGE